VLGEVLFDVYPDGRRVLGGAPFNVAWHLRGLGASPLLVTAVGDDLPGQRVLAAMAAWDMDTRAVQVVPGWPTGEVRVSLDGGQPRFEIRSGQAYDRLATPALPRLTATGGLALLYHGSLALRGEGNRAVVDTLVAASGLPVFLDVNLRAPWWSPQSIEGLLRRARWLKLNEEELDALAPGGAGQPPAERAARLLRETGVARVFLTLGRAGAWIVSAEGAARASPGPTRVVDTVGAGDAFSAIAILGLIRGWSDTQTLERAVELARILCGIRGAVTARRRLYQVLRERWGT
jgi:fructokinase